ncbi:2OG-Fe(II) oxygenase [Pleionea sp. CnH1-48]|uniref:2OG-Fe(II) oxygenase n=1 Tax=Pleionea sp. CnH1-48 TaxID=2954494 RepID=UPI002096B42F|nr:2OG-Fe(II) oxygenase [Pleionea sp. CnH1-48]MCO7226797.1 2OG-Fe(II) oxygenase [Pleionea sp. CnH1-48]
MQFVRVIDNALPDALCDELIQTFDKHPGVIDGKTGAGVDKSKKNSRDLTLDAHADLSPLHQQVLGHAFQHIKNYLLEIPGAFVGAISPTVIHPQTGQPVTLTLDNFAELGVPHIDALAQFILRSGVINIQRYEQRVGGYPYWHSEIYPQDNMCEPLHRVLFYIFYLNDVAEGGETEFLYQKEKVQAKKGRMLIAPAGFTHTHRGNFPLSGNKYILASWAMFRRAEHLYGQA